MQVDSNGCKVILSMQNITYKTYIFVLLKIVLILLAGFMPHSSAVPWDEEDRLTGRRPTQGNPPLPICIWFGWELVPQ